MLRVLLTCAVAVDAGAENADAVGGVFLLAVAESAGVAGNVVVGERRFKKCQLSKKR